ncbi:MAG: M20/M25/M40 family metallo-hydrolase [Eubacteriales bacterium]|nr:M20/M25/M40 family metallo-hydrolase [Eubacteriales bacterium]
MSEFLAPLNYDRAQDALRRLSVYTAYSPEGAKQVLDVLRQCYPLVFSKTEQKTFANDALLMELQGASITEPLIFTAHLDAPERGSFHPSNRPEASLCVPLSRAHVVSLLEALEELLRDGYRPGGDLFLALSMDGLSGGAGAESMAAHLNARGIKPCFVLDYGGYATMDAFRTYLPKGAPLALIGIAEKGLLTGRVTADDAVTVQQENARPLDELLKCGARFTRHSRKAALCDASRRMLWTVGRDSSFFKRLMMQHAGLTFPLIRCRWRGRSVMRQFFLSELTLYAMQAEGLPAAPARKAELSFRLTVIPGVQTAAMKKRMSRLLRNPALRLDTEVEYEHSRLSDPKGEAWDALETAIEIQFERAVIAPCLCPFITDGRFYTAMGEKVYRFSPFMVTGEEALSGLCTVTDGALQTAVQFFRSMLSV